MNNQEQHAASRPALASAIEPRNSEGVDARRARTPTLPLIITNSRVSSYMTCPRRHWWAYELGIRKQQSSEALGIGTAYHAGLETLNAGGTAEQAMANALAKVGTYDDTTMAIACSMVAGWEWRWSQNRLGKVIAAEQVFEWKPVKKARWSHAGKIDAIMELADGRLAVVEYKTTREDISPQSDYWRRLMIDRQISWYILGARAMGYAVDTVIYDVARVPGLRPRLLSRKAGATERENMEQYGARLSESYQEKPDWYFNREEVPRVEKDIEESMQDMAHLAETIRSARNAGRWPRNTDACRRWGTCPYFGPCSISHDPLTAGVPNGFIKVEDVNVELTIDRDTTQEDSNESGSN